MIRVHSYESMGTFDGPRFTLSRYFYKDAITDASIVPTPTQLTPKVKVRKQQ